MAYNMMPVNLILKDKITKLDYRLLPPNFNGDIRAIRMMQDSLSSHINSMGEQSADAQGLKRIITTSEKLIKSPTHILYLLKDASANGGNGQVIGLLKIASKHLFFFNGNGKVCEVDPLCVLDFFVLPDYQRTGCGKLLFDHMLRDLEAKPVQLAIDGPSMKMEKFLLKNYGITLLPRQNNNFAVSSEFFNLGPGVSSSGRCTPAELAPVGRFAAPKPQSTLGTIIHGDNSQCELSPPRFYRRGRMKYPWHASTKFSSNISSSGRCTPVEQAPVGRFSAPKPQSTLGTVIHGVTSQCEDFTPWKETVGSNDVGQTSEVISTEVVPPTAPVAFLLKPISELKIDADPGTQLDAAAETESEAAAAITKNKRPSSLSVDPVSEAPVQTLKLSPAGSLSSRQLSQFTPQGYFDVKFFHNKLW